MASLISFDIDGTLEFGDPPGLITVEMVRHAKQLGYIVGSCSDRTIGEQKLLWERHNLQVGFMVLKHQLDIVREKFEAKLYYHIGDTQVDRYYAEKAGFVYMTDQLALSEDWAK